MRATFSAIVLLVAVSLAQQPSPCSSSELRATFAETRLEAQRVELNTLRARLKAAEQDLVRQQGQSADMGQRLNSAASNVVALQSANESAQQKIAVLEGELAQRDKVIASVTAERDNEAVKIKRANGRWICEVFKVCTK